MPLVERVVVAHPYHLKLIVASTVKTDKIDTFVLARLLAANFVPTVWMPPVHVLELRGLVAHISPPSDLTEQRDWWANQPISGTEKPRARHDLVITDCLAPLSTEVEAELAQLSVSPAWTDQVPFLIQLLGMTY